MPITVQQNASTAYFGNKYSYLTYAQAAQQIASRLYDPTMTFWTETELGLYLAEALRTWNALTSYWRGEFVFTAQANATWYDLTNAANAPFMQNTLRALDLQDTDLYAYLQYHLLEPATGVNPWGGSKQFAADDLIRAVERRRNEILSACASSLTVRTVPAVNGRIVLPDSVTDIRRMAYLPDALYVAQGAPSASTMWVEDAWGEQSYDTAWPLVPAGVPFRYLVTTQPPVSFDTDIPPAYAGVYELLTLEAGAPLSAAVPQFLSIPDDWTHVIKWGALADLLSRESLAKDSPRAQYCETRYRMGLAGLASAPALLAARINDVAVQVDSVRAADLFAASWEAQAAGAPAAIYHAGLNLVALAPAASATGPFQVTASVVANAPMFSALTDFIQVGRDDLDAIIDYAQHLAAFKMGGAEFIATMPLLKRFLTQASLYGLKLAEIAEYTSALYGLGQRETDMNPLAQPAGASALASGGANG